MVVLDHHEILCEEEKRLKEDAERKQYWKRWGPYVAERQWATGVSSFMLLSLNYSTKRFSSSERGLLVQSLS